MYEERVVYWIPPPKLYNSLNSIKCLNCLHTTHPLTCTTDFTSTSPLSFAIYVFVNKSGKCNSPVFAIALWAGHDTYHFLSSQPPSLCPWSCDHLLHGLWKMLWKTKMNWWTVMNCQLSFLETWCIDFSIRIKTPRQKKIQYIQKTRL